MKRRVYITWRCFIFHSTFVFQRWSPVNISKLMEIGFKLGVRFRGSLKNDQILPRFLTDCYYLLPAWPSSPPGGWPFATYRQDGFFAAPSRATCRLSTWKTWISWGVRVTESSSNMILRVQVVLKNCRHLWQTRFTRWYKHELGLANYDIYVRKMETSSKETLIFWCLEFGTPRWLDCLNPSYSWYHSCSCCSLLMRFLLAEITEQHHRSYH